MDSVTSRTIATFASEVRAAGRSTVEMEGSKSDEGSGGMDTAHVCNYGRIATFSTPSRRLLNRSYASTILARVKR